MDTSPRAALIIVDVQNDFCPGGSLPITDGDLVVPVINRLMSIGWYRGIIVATRDWHEDPGDHFSDDPDYAKSWPHHCVIGTKGADFHPALNTEQILREFRKGRFEAAYSGFQGTDEDENSLAEFLRSCFIEEVDIVGLATDYCVKATALDAVKHLFKVRVLLQASRGVAEDTTTAAIEEMRAAGINVVVNIDILR